VKEFDVTLTRVKLKSESGFTAKFVRSILLWSDFVRSGLYL
jgi:hypothetical protein